MGIAPLYDQPAYERWRPRYHRRASGSGASASEQLLQSSAVWLTPRVNDDDNTYREDSGNFFLSEAADHSGNGRHFTQSTAANQFERLDAELNGESVWGPSAESKWLEGNAASLSVSRNVPALTCVAVLNLPDLTAKRVFTVNTGSGVTRAAFYTAAAGIVIGGRRLDGDSFQELSAARGAGNTGWRLFIVEFDYENANAKLIVDNSTIIDDAFQTAGNTSDTDSGLFYIASDAGETTALDERLAEIAFFQRVLTAQEKSDLWTGLGQGEWGLS